MNAMQRHAMQDTHAWGCNRVHKTYASFNGLGGILAIG
jgi:hypothetical protein